MFGGNPDWNVIFVAEGALFDDDARVLAIFGDSITTDHISPAGDIAAASPAGDFLKARGIEKKPDRAA